MVLWVVHRAGRGSKKGFWDDAGQTRALEGMHEGHSEGQSQTTSECAAG